MRINSLWGSSRNQINGKSAIGASASQHEATSHCHFQAHRRHQQYTCLGMTLVTGHHHEHKLSSWQQCVLPAMADLCTWWSRVLGAGNKNLNKIVEIFVKVLAHGSELADSETADQMLALLNQMQGSLPPQVLLLSWSIIVRLWSTCVMFNNSLNRPSAATECTVL